MSPAHAFDNPDPVRRLQQFGDFANWWFSDHPGERELSGLDVQAELGVLEIPVVLREFYELAKGWPIRRIESFYFGWNQNFFMYPRDLAASDVYTEHGLLRFATENQGVTWWACPADEDDPAVYDWMYEEDANAEPHPYPFGRCSDSLADFLTGFLLFEFAINGNSLGNHPGVVREIESESTSWNVLQRGIFGNEAVAGIFEEDTLCVNLDGTWWITPRTSATRADLLGRFAAELEALVFHWETGKDSDLTTWTFTLSPDGSGLFAAFVTGRGRIFRHEFEHALNLLAVHADLAPHVLEDSSDKRRAQMKTRTAGGQALTDGRKPTSGFLTLEALTPYIDRCLGLVRSGSPELTEAVASRLGYETSAKLN